LTLSVLAWFFIPFHFVLFMFNQFYSINEAFFSFNSLSFSWLFTLELLFNFYNNINLQVIDGNIALLILLALSSLNVYGIILAG